MTTCRATYRYICDNLDENLQSARCREIRRHLASCIRCRTYLGSVKKTVSLYHSMAVPGVPRGTHRLLLRAVEVMKRRAQKRTNSLTIPESQS